MKFECFEFMIDILFFNKKLQLQISRIRELNILNLLKWQGCILCLQGNGNVNNLLKSKIKNAINTFKIMKTIMFSFNKKTQNRGTFILY